MFPFSINRYRGLSGNHGNSISWMAVGNTTRDKSRGQYSSCEGGKTFTKSISKSDPEEIELENFLRFFYYIFVFLLLGLMVYCV